MSKLNHFNETGGAHMVDISDKNDTTRVAIATGRIRMQAATADVIRQGTAQKGDVLGVAQVAGIMAAKNTSQMIPMCHPLMLTGTDIRFEVGDDAVEITATIKTSGKTGVEMEALTAVSVTALTIFDMVKATDKSMVIEDIKVESKTGGKSGDWVREIPSAAVCEDGSCEVNFGDAPAAIDLEALSSLRSNGAKGFGDGENGES